jgi:hypothetical protein
MEIYFMYIVVWIWISCQHPLDYSLQDTFGTRRVTVHTTLTLSDIEIMLDPRLRK